MNRSIEGLHRRQRDFVEKAARSIPALTFAAALLLMVNQSDVAVLMAVGRARFLPILILCGIAALWLVGTRRLPRRPRWFDLCALGFLAWALGSSTWAYDPWMSLGRALSVVATYAAVFWAMWMEVDRHGPLRIMRALVAATALAVAMSYSAIPIGPSAGFDLSWRFAGFMSNPNALGALVALTLPLALWSATRNRTRASWALVALMLVAAQLTQSRTTAIAGIVGGGYYLFHAVPRRRAMLAIWSVFYLGLTILLPQATWAYHEHTSRQATKVELEQKFQEAARRLKAAQQQAEREKLAPLRAKAQGIKPAPPPVAAPPPRTARVSKPADIVPASKPAPPLATAPSPTPPVPAKPKAPPEPDLPYEVKQALNTYNELKEAVEYSRRPAAPELIDPLKNPRNMNLSTLSGRTVAWQLGVRYLFERPFTGFGFGNEELVLPGHGILPGIWIFNGYRFHNSYLGLAMQVGVIAALLFYLPLAALTLAEWRVPAQLDDGTLRYALRGVLFTGLVVAFFESWIYSMGSAHAFPFWTSVMLLTWMRTTVDSGQCAVRSSGGPRDGAANIQ